MKIYSLHISQGDEEIHITFESNAPNFIRAYSAFSSVCYSMLRGFGDAKGSKLYRAMEKLDKSGKETLEYKYQGEYIKIMVDVQ